jgi:hypothetical protein
LRSPAERTEGAVLFVVGPSGLSCVEISDHLWPGRR